MTLLRDLIVVEVRAAVWDRWPKLVCEVVADEAGVPHSLCVKVGSTYLGLDMKPERYGKSKLERLALAKVAWLDGKPVEMLADFWKVLDARAREICGAWKTPVWYLREVMAEGDIAQTCCWCAVHMKFLFNELDGGSTQSSPMEVDADSGQHVWRCKRCGGTMRIVLIHYGYLQASDKFGQPFVLGTKAHSLWFPHEPPVSSKPASVGALEEALQSAAGIDALNAEHCPAYCEMVDAIGEDEPGLVLPKTGPAAPLSIGYYSAGTTIPKWHPDACNDAMAALKAAPEKLRPSLAAKSAIELPMTSLVKRYLFLCDKCQDARQASVEWEQHNGAYEPLLGKVEAHYKTHADVKSGVNGLHVSSPSKEPLPMWTPGAFKAALAVLAAEPKSKQPEVSALSSIEMAQNGMTKDVMWLCAHPDCMCVRRSTLQWEPSKSAGNGVKWADTVFKRILAHYASHK